MKVSLERWNEANENELSLHWNGLFNNGFDYAFNSTKSQWERYIPVMDLPNNGTLNNISVLDIGGGPFSLLHNYIGIRDCVVIDPLTIPDKCHDFYKSKGIEYMQCCAEDFLTSNHEKGFDEVWIYNCLQHVQDIDIIINNISKFSGKLRICEPVGTPIDTLHPHSFSSAADLWNTIDNVSFSLGTSHISRQYDYIYAGGVFSLQVK